MDLSPSLSQSLSQEQIDELIEQVELIEQTNRTSRDAPDPERPDDPELPAPDLQQPHWSALRLLN